MNSSLRTRLKETTFYALVCLSIIFAGCNTREPTSSLPPQPPVAQTQGTALDTSISSAGSSDVVWDVRDEEVVWGSTSALAEEGESTTELLEESESDDHSLVTESFSAGSDISAASTSSEATEERPLKNSNANTLSYRLRRAEPLSDVRSESPALTNQSGNEAGRANANSLTYPAAPLAPIHRETENSGASTPPVAENGSIYGETSPATGRPKTVHVDGYYRKDGTYVRGHYRSAPRRRN